MRSHRHSPATLVLHLAVCICTIFGLVLVGPLALPPLRARGVEEGTVAFEGRPAESLSRPTAARAVPFLRFADDASLPPVAEAADSLTTVPIGPLSGPLTFHAVTSTPPKVPTLEGTETSVDPPDANGPFPPPPEPQPVLPPVPPASLKANGAPGGRAAGR